MDINLTNKDGVKLNTAGKYCAEDINVIPQLDTATVTPAKGQQVIQPSNNKIGFSSVTVEAIPDDYVILSGTQQITENGTYDVSGKANAVVNVPTAKPEQTKTVEITSNGTTKITADSGKVLTEVTVTVNVPSEQPTLNAPTISLSDSTLTITNPATNGNFATAYKVYDGETLVATVTTTTVDLSAYITTAGTHTITVKAAGTNFVDSAASNAVSVTKAAVGYKLTVTLVGSYKENGDADIVYADGTSATVKADGTYNNVATVKSVGVNLGEYVMKDSSGSSHDAPYNLTSDTTLEIRWMPCIIEGTQITLANGSTKAIEDITYDDELLVWNFYEGKFDSAKPRWIKVEQTTSRYCLVKFSNGAEVGFVGPGERTRKSDGGRGYHRIFNNEAGAFTYVGTEETPIGTTTFADDNSFPTVISEEVVEKEVKFYNIMTEKHFNIFANGILTSCRLSNMYRIENMKYVGERLITDEQVKAYFERRKKLTKKRK